MIVIPRQRSGSADGPWWWPFGRSAVVACPTGHTAMLDHGIAADGTVTPSLVCPAELCDWHVMARLEGWSS